MLYIILIIFVFVPLLYFVDALFFSDKRKEISAEIYKPDLDKYKKESKPDELRKYHNLFKKGMLDEKEYEKIKKKLLE
jgi:uncharacterized membrane protein